MSKHTPGPWFVVAEDGTDFTAISRKATIDRYRDFDNEVLGTSEWLIVEPADLRLMAAAPELLEALEMIIDFPGTGPATSAARAAIAKAKGEQP